MVGTPAVVQGLLWRDTGAESKKYERNETRARRVNRQNGADTNGRPAVAAAHRHARGVHLMVAFLMETCAPRRQEAVVCRSRPVDNRLHSLAPKKASHAESARTPHSSPGSFPNLGRCLASTSSSKLPGCSSESPRHLAASSRSAMRWRWASWGPPRANLCMQ